MSNTNFESLNFQTKPTTVAMEEIKVVINPDLFIKGYAKAYVKELTRRNPVRMEAVGLTEGELNMYFEGLLELRVQSVTNSCPMWRQAKQLLVPSWIEFILTQVGEVVDIDRGLKITPIMTDADVKDEKAWMEQMLAVSSKLQAFLSDGVVMHKDALPRGTEGDVDTMSMAVINDYIMSMSKQAHPISSYAAAFLGLKIQEESSFKMLYRVRYDDVEYIRTMLLNENSIY